MVERESHARRIAKSQYPVIVGGAVIFGASFVAEALVLRESETAKVLFSFFKNVGLFSAYLSLLVQGGAGLAEILNRRKRLKNQVSH